MGNEDLFTDMTESSEEGRMNLIELMGFLLKLRGNVQKGDVVANWGLIRRMTEKLEEFETMMLQNQREMLDNQREIKLSTTSCSAAPVQKLPRSTTPAHL